MKFQPFEIVLPKVKIFYVFLKIQVNFDTQILVWVQNASHNFVLKIYARICKFLA